MFKAIAPISILVFSLSAHALWIESVTPGGTEVEPTTDSIVIKFSDNIVKLGENKKFRAEHKAKIDFGGIDCEPTYVGTKTIKCKIKKTLTPNRDYTINVMAGFQGIGLEEKLNSDNGNTFHRRV